MKTMLIAIMLMAYVSGEQVTVEPHITYHEANEVEFEVTKAYYIDGERITELKVVDYDWEAD